MKRLIVFGISSILILFILPLIFPDRIPPADLTRSRMGFDRVRIFEYAHAHGRLPSDLSALPKLALKPEADHSYFEDAWHRNLIYEVDQSGTVTLKSFGRDGVPGGSGDDADIILKFPSRRKDGSWSEATEPF